LKQTTSSPFAHRLTSERVCSTIVVGVPALISFLVPLSACQLPYIFIYQLVQETASNGGDAETVPCATNNHGAGLCCNRFGPVTVVQSLWASYCGPVTVGQLLWGSLYGPVTVVQTQGSDRKVFQLRAHSGQGHSKPARFAPTTCPSFTGVFGIAILGRNWCSGFAFSCR
jgi:hypothetical protein